VTTAVAAGPRYRIAPGATLGGDLRVPGDKSVSHRALLFGGIAEGTTEIQGFLDSEDCLATLQALSALGVRSGRQGQHVTVHGVGRAGLRAPAAALDMGNAGTAMRLFMGLLSGQPFTSRLIGDASLSRRPMERVAVPLRLMGARIHTSDGHPPVTIDGGAALRGIEYTLPVASAQIKSALLLAGLFAEGVTTVIEPVVTRDHTERMLDAFGVEVRRNGLRRSLRGGQSLRACEVAVPGDFSSAAFFIVAGCLAAPRGLILRHVGVNPTRTGLLDMLRAMGADIEVHPLTSVRGEPIADIQVRASRLRGIRVPEALVSLAIDEFPVFFIAAAAAEGETVVTGAGELRVKESDRLAVMAEGLKRLGVQTELLPDGMRVVGGTLGGGCVDSHGDHRVAMAFAVASLRATGTIEVDDVANVATSFPGFPELARQVGLPVELLA
jgi:3-phosphoshikimate 1-carboxyvinyltransferase